MNRKQQAYRNAGIYMGAFFLLLLLLRLDVRAIGADGTNVGLSHLNGAVHFITRSHPWIYAFTQLLGWVALVVAASSSKKEPCGRCGGLRACFRCTR